MGIYIPQTVPYKSQIKYLLSKEQIISENVATAFEEHPNSDQIWTYTELLKRRLTLHLSRYHYITLINKTHIGTLKCIYIKWFQGIGYIAMYTKIYTTCYYPVCLVSESNTLPMWYAIEIIMGQWVTWFYK